MEEPTVIEQARRAAGLSQAQLAGLARTSQSSVSEYESRRKSPTLDVVVRLLDAADATLAVRPKTYFDLVEDPAVGRYWVPDQFWSVPVPTCFARVQVLKYTLPPEATAGWADGFREWDLSVEAERIDYYSVMLRHGMPQVLEDSVDAILLIQAWPRLDLPEVIRAAWQPLIDATTATQPGTLRDPGGFSAWMANEIGLWWPPKPRRRRRRVDSE